MRKFTWILIFILTLLLLVYFLRSAIPRLPFTEPPDENALAHPEDIDSAYTLLICDRSAARGSEFIVLRVPQSGLPLALYLPGNTLVSGQTLSSLHMQGSVMVRRALEPYIPIDHYVAIDLNAVDSLTEYLAGSQPPESPLVFLADLLRNALRFETAGRFLSELRIIADELETDLTSPQILLLASRMNGINPADFHIYTVADPSALPVVAAQFLEGR